MHHIWLSHGNMLSGSICLSVYFKINSDIFWGRGVLFFLTIICYFFKKKNSGLGDCCYSGLRYYVFTYLVCVQMFEHYVFNMVLATVWSLKVVKN